MKLALSPFPLLFVLALPALSGDVILVRADGSGDHVDLPAAVAAAQDGDILLVGPGGFSAPLLVDRSLSIVSEAGGTFVSGNTQVQHLGAGRAVLLSGLTFGGTNQSTPALRIRRCAGPVRLDGCTVRGHDEFGFCSGGTALAVRSSRDVGVVHTDLFGGIGGNDIGSCGPSPSSGHGLLARHARVAFWRSTSTGGDSPDGTGHDLPIPGGDGAWLRGVELFSLQCLFRGGAGGGEVGGSALCAPGGDGIRGVHTTSREVRVWERASVFQGGGGGEASCADGVGLNLPAGADEHLPGSPRHLEAPRVVAAGGTLQLTVSGKNKDRVALVVSERSELHFDPVRGGAWSIGPPALLELVPLGVVDATGKLQVTFAAPTLPPGEEGRVFYLQAVARDKNGLDQLANPVTLLVLQ